jgi:hypothetical protein
MKNISVIALILFATRVPVFTPDGPTGTWQAMEGG